jgi:hypothetical protein
MASVLARQASRTAWSAQTEDVPAAAEATERTDWLVVVWAAARERKRETGRMERYMMDNVCLESRLWQECI